jgi:L-aminopeptidase/D-esterase-like protein
MAETDVAGVRVGHWTDEAARTGCTVVLLPQEGAVASCEVRGSAPGTRETDLLRTGMLVERVHAILLAGGSAFGLAAADGVVQHLRERGVGLETAKARVPIVPGAVVYDLGAGDPGAYPGLEAGRAACQDAMRDGALLLGAVGAGTGATVGKLLGPDASCPGGFGAATVRLPGGGVVVALAVANALGDVVDDDGQVVAGARVGGGFANAWSRVLERGLAPPPAAPANTTLGVIATDDPLTKDQCRKLAEQGQDGLALAIRPAHTMWDGDTVFAVSTGQATAADPARILSLGVAAAEAMRRAVVRAVSRG